VLEEEELAIAKELDLRFLRAVGARGVVDGLAEATADDDLRRIARRRAIEAVRVASDQPTLDRLHAGRERALVSPDRPDRREPAAVVADRRHVRSSPFRRSPPRCWAPPSAGT